jgi:hypothetical protein
MAKKRNIKKKKRPDKPDKTPRPPPTNKNVAAQVAAQPLAAVAPGIRGRLQSFFSQYSDFKYRPGNSSVPEFHRLCKEYGWERDDSEEKAARHEFDLIMKTEFDALYGSDEKDITNWHKLCHVLSIDPFPKTLKECRAVSYYLHRPSNSRLIESSSPLPGRRKEACQSCRPR